MHEDARVAYARSSRRTMAPVSRNSKASARLVLPLLFGLQTAVIVCDNASVCGFAPKAQKPWISTFLLEFSHFPPRGLDLG